MASIVGDRLPETLCDLLSGRALPGVLGEAILITTVDGEGWPHPALLSFGELAAMDARRIRLAVYRTSRTSENLRRNGRLTLCLIRAGMAYYVKAKANPQQDPMRDFPGLACFEAKVGVVLRDEARQDLEPGARLTGGITFDPGRPAAEWLRDCEALAAGLREEA